MQEKKNQILDRLYQRKDFATQGKTKYHPGNYNLNKVEKLSAYFDYPQNKIKTIHVAGTNGKGSVCWYLAQALKHLGIRSAIYSSPHLFDERERFWVDGDYVEWDRLLSVLDEVLNVVEQKKLANTVFDIFTVSGFLLFAQSKVEIAVIETGLGGRLDSTNIIHPELAIITSVGMDHCDKLGYTLTQIAREKAGIIKKNRPVYLMNQSSEVIDVISSVADNQNADFHLIHFPKTPKKLEKKTDKNNHLAAKTLKNNYLEQNYFFASEILKRQVWLKKNYSVKLTQDLAGFVPPAIAGRLQWKGGVLFDVSHNPQGIRALSLYLRSHYPKAKKKFVFYQLPDKDYKENLKILLELGEVLYFPLQLNFIKNSEALSKTRKEINESQGVKVLSNPQGLIKTYLNLEKEQREQSMLIVCGSFYCVSSLFSLVPEMHRG